MVMRKENVKEASTEIVDGLKCILEAQFGMRSKRSCVPALKLPVHRFCRIAKQTAKRFKKEDPEYEISRFLGAGPRPRRKMGIVCSAESSFPKCDDAVKARDYAGASYTTDTYQEYHKKLDVAYAKNFKCIKEVGKAIKENPVERSKDFDKLLSSFETMRDWMHVSGYVLPDYVWVTPKTLRTKVKRLFEYLSSAKVTSTADLDRKRREIEKW